MSVSVLFTQATTRGIDTMQAPVTPRGIFLVFVLFVLGVLGDIPVLDTGNATFYLITRKEGEGEWRVS